ncbi:MAG: hypothetical protein MZV63_37000 [Marinilabiliales bacterium]|nr:hypothetical protein [Marinilabiliales bacterium]
MTTGLVDTGKDFGSGYSPAITRKPVIGMFCGDRHILPPQSASYGISSRES